VKDMPLKASTPHVRVHFLEYGEIRPHQVQHWRWVTDLRGSLVISGVPNYLIFQGNKAYPDRSKWIRWNKCLTFRMP
jgi:hypothetical protein